MTDPISYFDNSSILCLETLSSSTHLTWHGLNDPLNVTYFLKSSIPWGESDVRLGPDGHLVLRHDPPEELHWEHSELMRFDDWVDALVRGGKKMVMDLKEGGEALDQVISILRRHSLNANHLWFATSLKDVSVEDYTKLRQAFPAAVFSSTIPLRFMFQSMDRAQRETWYEINRSMGATRFSVSWHDHPQPEEVTEVHQAGFEINLYHVNTLEDFRQAIRLNPKAITSDFHIPVWNLFGRGAGENGFYLDLPQTTAPLSATLSG